MVRSSPLVEASGEEDARHEARAVRSDIGAETSILNLVKVIHQ
jgi:hypothetical protein